MLYVGIDPGLKGALAVYCSEQNAIVAMNDMPTYKEGAGKRKRDRVDVVGLVELCELYAMMGARMALIEKISTRRGEGAAGALTMGYGYGVIVTALHYSGVPTETTASATWKRLMEVPGKAKATDDELVQFAERLFPADVKMFRGIRGGKRVDRAEAAMLGLYASRFVDNAAGRKGDAETEALLSGK